MNVENLIFDLDGTLVHSLPGIEYSVDRAIQALGYPLRRTSLRPLIGPPIRQILGKAVGESAADNLDGLERVFRGSYDSEGWRRTALKPGAGELLQALARSRRLFLVTNKPSQATARILERFDLSTVFARVLCRDSATPSYSSKRDMLRALMCLEQIDARTSMMVGDTEEDLAAARHAGLRAVILRDGYGEFPQAPSEPSCQFVQTLSDLPSVVGEAE